MNELHLNVNNSSIDKDNSSNNSHKVLFYCKNKFLKIKDSIIYYNLGLYSNNGKIEGRICLFNSYTYSVEEIAKFKHLYWPYQLTTTKDKVNFYVCYFLIICHISDFCN